MIRLIVHLGAGKCGSSAIQQYLSQRSIPGLRKNGILAPSRTMEASGDFDGQQVWYFQSLLPIDESRIVEFRDRLFRLRDQAQLAGCHTIILSGENLIHPVGFHKLFVGTEDHFDLRLLLYIRRQDDFVIAAWQQWYLKKGWTIAQYLSGYARTIGDWAKFLSHWENAFGPARITVRRYGTQYLVDGDVIADFFLATGLNKSGCTELSALINPRINEAIGRMGNRVADVFRDTDDNRFYESFAFAIGEKAFQTSTTSALLSHVQRLELLKMYDAGNEMLKQRYFPELASHEPLFALPVPEDLSPYLQNRNVRKSTSCLSVLSMGLHRRALAHEVKVPAQAKELSGRMVTCVRPSVPVSLQSFPHFWAAWQLGFSGSPVCGQSEAPEVAARRAAIETNAKLLFFQSMHRV